MVVVARSSPKLRQHIGVLQPLVDTVPDLHLLTTNAADVSDICVDMLDRSRLIRAHGSRRAALRSIIARRLPMRTSRGQS